MARPLIDILHDLAVSRAAIDAAVEVTHGYEQELIDAQWEAIDKQPGQVVDHPDPDVGRAVIVAAEFSPSGAAVVYVSPEREDGTFNTAANITTIVAPDVPLSKDQTVVDTPLPVGVLDPVTGEPTAVPDEPAQPADPAVIVKGEAHGD